MRGDERMAREAEAELAMLVPLVMAHGSLAGDGFVLGDITVEQISDAAGRAERISATRLEILFRPSLLIGTLGCAQRVDIRRGGIPLLRKARTDVETLYGQFVL